MSHRWRPQMSVCRWPVGFMLLVAIVAGGCSELTGSPGLPAGTPTPSFYSNKEGAIGMRNAAVLNVEQALGQYIVDAGLLTDELEDRTAGAGQGALLLATGVTDPLDERILPSGVTVMSYGSLQGSRTLIAQAIGALTAYDTAPADSVSAKVLRGELYAFDGYMEILLADLFCSGVPLSTLDFQKDFTYAPSSTTKQVYEAALAKFDTALTLAVGVSDSVRYLALVGKGRAYLALNNYLAAADDVKTVPDAFRYMVSVVFVNPLSNTATVSDSEGQNGIRFLSSRDPRSTVDTTVQVGQFFLSRGLLNQVPFTFPRKYETALNGSGYAPFLLGSGTEARLIQVEEALQGGNATSGTWLTILNQLRTSGSMTALVPDTIVDTLGITGCTSPTACDAAGHQVGVNYAAYTFVDSTQITPPNSTVAACQANMPNAATYLCDPATVSVYADPAHVHQVTIWQAGTGGVAGLPPLIDPGASLTGTAASAARVALLFRERAFWLFFDGHRQGDLRRLLRQYTVFRDPGRVYPTGLYLALGTGRYGSDVVAPIPPSEAPNPLFHGCLDENP